MQTLTFCVFSGGEAHTPMIAILFLLFFYKGRVL